MPTTIVRGIDTFGIAAPLQVGTATTTGFSMSGSAGAIVIVTAVSGGATSLSFSVLPSPSSTSTPATLTDSTGTTVTQPISANVAFDLPAGLFAAPWVMPRTNAGTADLRIIAKS